VAEPHGRTADQSQLERDREQRADGDDRDRGTEDGEMAHADERLLVPQRLHDREPGLVRGGSNIRPGVYPVLAVGVTDHATYDAAGLERPDLLAGEVRPVGSVRSEGNDAHGPLPCPDPAGGEVDQLARPRLALARPHRLDRAEPGEAV